MPHSSPTTVPCLIRTWQSAESILFLWLNKQCGDRDLAYDLVQETFLRALQQQQAFCQIHNQQAWLFRVARHLLTDEWRHHHRFDHNADPADCIPTHSPTSAPVDELTQCLPRALNQLTAQERDIIFQCDLRGIRQIDYAHQQGITLSAAKSRIQRARKKLKNIMKIQCHIRFNDLNQVTSFYATPPHS